MIRVKVKSNNKFIYRVEYAVSNNLEGWNGVRFIDIETEKEITKKEMNEHIRRDNVGHIGMYATITLRGCVLKEIKTRRLF